MFNVMASIRLKNGYVVGLGHGVETIAAEGERHLTTNSAAKARYPRSRHRETWLQSKVKR